MSTNLGKVIGAAKKPASGFVTYSRDGTTSLLPLEDRAIESVVEYLSDCKTVVFTSGIYGENEIRCKVTCVIFKGKALILKARNSRPDAVSISDVLESMKAIYGPPSEHAYDYSMRWRDDSVALIFDAIAFKQYKYYDVIILDKHAMELRDQEWKKSKELKEHEEKKKKEKIKEKTRRDFEP